MNAHKKIIERNYATALMRSLGHTEVLLQDKEPPDFVFELGGRTIGIEVTELMRKEHNGVQYEHVQESEQLKVVDLACEHYIALGGTPLHVSVHFTSNRIDLSNRRRVAEWIADLLYRNQVPARCRFTWERTTSAVGGYPECLSAIFAYRLTNGRQHFWTAPRSGWVNAGLEDALTEALRAKDTKCATYLKECDECWLLLVADWNRGVSFFESSEAANFNLPKCSFSRVYFFDRFSDGVPQLLS